MSQMLKYSAVNQPVLESVPLHARRILDVGCGTGALGAALKARQPAEVVGLTYSEAEAICARQSLDLVVVTDLNRFDATGLREFDCILCSHVLEHLNWPDEFLRAVRPLLSPAGCLIVALPNGLAWRQRVRFLLGEFRYTDGGLMDRTHFRFFDWQTARELVSDAGFVVEKSWADGILPLSRWLPFRDHLDTLATRLFPGLFGWQFIVIGRAR